MKLLISALFVFIVNIVNAADTYPETLYPAWQQQFSVDKLLYRDQTKLQDLIIFENAYYGKVLALDGIIQLTTKDEFVYHEMLVHVPMMTHPNPKNVLVIGGGDGGSLREVLKHSCVEKATLVDIDQGVIELCKKYLPEVSKGAFDHEKANIVICDGAKFVKETEERYDVIICDTTDPIGPGEALFTEEFYKNCANILTEDGIMVNQNGVPFMQADELYDALEYRKPYFSKVSYYLAPVPTYVGGFMAFGYATKSTRKCPACCPIKARVQAFDGQLKYYNSCIHKASFAKPNFLTK